MKIELTDKEAEILESLFDNLLNEGLEKEFRYVVRSVLDKISNYNTQSTKKKEELKPATAPHAPKLKLKESVRDSIKKLSITEEAGQDLAKAKSAELMKKGIKSKISFDTVTWEEGGKIYTFNGKTNKTLVKDKQGGSFVGSKKTPEEELGGSFENITK